MNNDYAKWSDNINSIMNNGKVGICPCCGSEDVGFKVVEVANKYGYADIWCNRCKKAIHLSRIKINDSDKVLENRLKTVIEHGKS